MPVLLPNDDEPEPGIGRHGLKVPVVMQPHVLMGDTKRVDDHVSGFADGDPDDSQMPVIPRGTNSEVLIRHSAGIGRADARPARQLLSSG
jgi:hypothetical protein